MGNENANSVFCNVGSSCAENEQRLSAIVKIQLVALVDFISERIVLISRRLHHFNGFVNSLSLSLAVVEEFFVALAIFGYTLALRLVGNSVDVLSFIGQIHKAPRV